MRKILLLALALLCNCTAAFSQSSIREARQKSWQRFVYRISADTAEKYINKQEIFPESYLDQEPVASWQADSLRNEELPVGNYLIISVDGNEILAEYYCQSNLRVFPLNNQHRVQLEIKDDNGNTASNARLWINKKEIKYQETIKGFQLKQRKADAAILKIAVPGDTLFMELSAMDEVYKNAWQQWWTNFSSSKMGSIVSWPVRKVRRLWKLPVNEWFRKRYRVISSKNGYMIFNKPQYLPGDTVRFKAYILNKRGKKQYRKKLTMFLDYTFNGKSVTRNMGIIRPVTPGSFIHEFVLGDSLESDRNYRIRFINSKDQVLLGGTFDIEDYVLEEVATYNLRSEKEEYSRHDTLVFYANARDANGLPLMDGKLSFYLLAERIDQFYSEREFIPDTIWKIEKSLSVNGDTKIAILAKDLPNADLSLTAVAEFRNSDNEIQEKKEEVKLAAGSKLIRLREENGYIIAEYLEEGILMPKDGWLLYDEEDKERRISFPWRQKLNPFIKEYWFGTEDGKNSIMEIFEPDREYTISFSRQQQKDTSGFYLYNPKRIPIHYTIFNGSKIIETRSDTAEQISWKKLLPKKRIYTVEWNYIWAGEERKGWNSIALLDKILQTKISGAQTVYPGQTDTITVVVKDYKGRPAANVNLTAVSYNSQFKEDIRVPEPPYLQKFKTRRKIVFDNYELDGIGFKKRLELGKHQQWRKVFGLDTMKYYQLLFPGEGYAISSSPVTDFPAQLAVHAVRKGIPQEIYLLYINREFAWYNGVTDKAKYAFSVVPGYTQIAFRLRDKYIEIDSIYLQPFYKHDISFDLDSLPANTKVIEYGNYYTEGERALIEKQIWNLEDNNRTNQGYVWQANRLVRIGSTKSYRGHLIGPFTAQDSLHFYKPGDFDFKFPFEPGYQYRLTPSMARLEKKSVFHSVGKVLLPSVAHANWSLGDTIVAVPVIDYTPKTVIPFLPPIEKKYPRPTSQGMGALELQLPKDSNFVFAILYGKWPDTLIINIKEDRLNGFSGIFPGKYEIVLVTAAHRFLSATGLDIKANGTLCLQFNNPVYNDFHPVIEEAWQVYEKSQREALQKIYREKPSVVENVFDFHGLPMPAGSSSISGVVTDKKGKESVIGVTVHLKGFNKAALSGVDGSFLLNNIKPGNYVIVFSSVGYVPLEKKLTLLEGQTATVDAELAMSVAHLSEVVVVGYGTSRKRDLTGSISTVRQENLTNLLQGKAAGVSIQLRGVSSLSLADNPLYIVNGVPMDNLPESFVMEGTQVNILQGETAVNLYGSRAANGAIVITTPDFLPKGIRDQFRDYASWQPNLFTDKNGEASFAVTYPDNITGWQTYVLGMDKKRRLTKASYFIKSVKPFLAQLSTPQFLVEGDSSLLIGKLINYTSAEMTLTSIFKKNDTVVDRVTRSIHPNASLIDQLPVVTKSQDSLKLEYSVTTSSGYSDGEIRKIPVFRKGIEETKGQFWILDKDTSFSFQPDKNAGDINFYVQNNTLDVLVDEIDQLKRYPYYCMEQTASKLTGLLMEKKIRETLKQSFDAEKEISQLVAKLQRSQLFNGGWSWWEAGEANQSITNYVTRSVLPLRNDQLLQTNIRNAILYLQNRIPLLKGKELLPVLFTLSEARHEMDYGQYLNKLNFDSLTIHQQWQFVSIKKQQNLSYKTELEKLIAEKSETMLGSIYWGTDSFNWENNAMASTVLAYKVLTGEKPYQSYFKKIIQFFLERRRDGRWANTVESASILSAILPDILKEKAEFQSPARLQIAGKGIHRVDKFPFAGKVTDASSSLTISRTGGGLLYFSLWQTMFNPQPEAVNDKFTINTWFEKKGVVVEELIAGEKLTMKIRLQVLKDADYVQIEIPIPAGCTYANKKQVDWKVHREFLKNKVILFVEKMNTGVYEYEIELEPRYSGRYQLNPAKAELMYFPVYFGRNNMRECRVKSSSKNLDN